MKPTRNRTSFPEPACRSSKLFDYRRFLLKTARTLAWTIIAIVILRLFVIDIYQVNSVSMEETLYSGDVIVVDKWLLPGEWRSLRRNDVIVFDKSGTDQMFVKRCVGLPGDTIEIIHNTRYANGVYQQEPASVKYSYLLQTVTPSSGNDLFRKHGLTAENYLWRDGNYMHASITKKGAAALKKNHLVDSISIDDYPKGSKGPLLFTGSPTGNHTRENYGPVTVPSKGKTIALQKENLELYRQVIVEYEQNTLEVAGGEILINNKRTDTYTFKGDYYFVMGDNRYHSIDSRYWGFLPQGAIIGRVMGVLFSRGAVSGSKK